MPHKESIQDGELVTWLNGARHVWTVSTNVGYGYKNRPEDVRLVQYFLNVEFSTWGEGTNPPKPLVTDGIFGGKTWRAIKTFQNAWGLVEDGMITPVNGIKIVGKQGRVYAMYHLNYWYKETKGAHYEDLRSDPDLPGELRGYLSKPLPDLD